MLWIRSAVAGIAGAGAGARDRAGAGAGAGAVLVLGQAVIHQPLRLLGSKPARKFPLQLMVGDRKAVNRRSVRTANSPPA